MLVVATILDGPSDSVQWKELNDHPATPQPASARTKNVVVVSDSPGVGRSRRNFLPVNFKPQSRSRRLPTHRVDHEGMRRLRNLRRYQLPATYRLSTTSLPISLDPLLQPLAARSSNANRHASCSIGHRDLFAGFSPLPLHAIASPAGVIGDVAGGC